MGIEIIDLNVIKLKSEPTTEDGSFVTLQPPPPNDSVPGGYLWIVSGISVAVAPLNENRPITPIFCGVFDRDPSIAQAPISQTRTGAADCNDTCRLIIAAGDSVYFEWLLVPAGQTCYARFQYELVQVTGATATRPVMY